MMLLPRIQQQEIMYMRIVCHVSDALGLGEDVAEGGVGDAGAAGAGEEGGEEEFGT